MVTERGARAGSALEGAAGLGRMLPGMPFGSGRVRRALVAISAAALLGVGVPLAVWPLVTAGIVLGGALLSATLLWPLAMVGAMLVIGPADLSFITGGFKELFPELGGLDMNGLRLIGMTVGLMAVVLSDRSVLRRAFGPYGRWYVIFLVYAAATLWVSASVIDGLRLLLKIMYPFLVFVVVLGVARSRRDVDRLADWALVGAAVIVLLNPIFVLVGGYEIDPEGRMRMRLAGVHENPFSFYLLILLFVAMGRFLVRRHVRYVLLMAALAVWIGLTLTRITVLAGVLGLLAMAVYGVLRNRDRDYVGVWATGVGALVLGGALAPLVLERTFGHVPSIVELLTLARDPAYLVQRVNWQGRMVYWAVIYQAFTTSPVFGLGLGTSTAIILANFSRESGMVVHNEYLRLAAETGVVGVALYGLAVVPWMLGILRASRAASEVAREFVLPGIGAIVAWSIIAITDNAFDYYAPFTQFVGFLTAGALVCAERGGEDGSESEVPRAPTAAVGPRAVKAAIGQTAPPS